MKRALFTILLAASLTLPGCTQPQTTPTEQPLPAEDEGLVALEAQGKRIGDIVTLSGSATVPDGALLSYQLGDGSFTTPDGEAAVAVGNAVVENQRFKVEVDVPGWPDPIPAWVAFQTIVGFDEQQPAEVLELYGRKGEKMRGDTVRSGDLTILETEFSVSR